jgi:hypothetical protein
MSPPPTNPSVIWRARPPFATAHRYVLLMRTGRTANGAVAAGAANLSIVLVNRAASTGDLASMSIPVSLAALLGVVCLALVLLLTIEAIARAETDRAEDDRGHLF